MATDDSFSYRDYVTDGHFAERYNAYQARYAERPRESDKRLITAVAELAGRNPEPLSLLDIGCSTGNLLVHLGRALPDLSLAGGDLMESSLEACRANPALAHGTFERLDILDLPRIHRYDVVTVNAVLYMLNDHEFRRALSNIRNVLKPRGTLMAFDFFHPHRQQLAIRETSASHPDGLMLHFRPMAVVEQWLTELGYDEIRFEEFSIGIDLKGNLGADRDPDGFEDLNSVTLKTEGGERLLFRGALYQPWCHLFARWKG